MGALALLVTTATLVAAPTRAEERAYTTESGVRLAPTMERTVAQLATEFRRRTGRGFHVTSGTRSADEQAEAMYDKIRHGTRLTRLYRDFGAASEIQSAYRRHRRRGRRRCVSQMARVIRAQIGRGCFISRHLRASAVDIRSRDMSRRERRIFRQVVASHGQVSLLEEGRPPHFHLQLR